MAAVFLPSSTSCVDGFAFNSSIFISRRRVEMANSARSRCLSARISTIDIGVDALRDQLRASEKENQIKSRVLSEAERQLADKEAELTKLLGERSLVAR